MDTINDENTIFINNKATGNCEYESGKGSKISYEKLLSKNPDMEICYRPNYKTVFAVKTIQRPGTYETQTNKNCNQVFEDAIVLCMSTFYKYCSYMYIIYNLYASMCDYIMSQERLPTPGAHYVLHKPFSSI